jgi:hypothetical protein
MQLADQSKETREVQQTDVPIELLHPRPDIQWQLKQAQEAHFAAFSLQHLGLTHRQRCPVRVSSNGIRSCRLYALDGYVVHGKSFLYAFKTWLSFKPAHAEHTWASVDVFR